MKKNLALVFTILGAIGLIFGVVMLLTGEITESRSWIGAILGIIFFTSGMGLMRSTGGTSQE